MRDEENDRPAWGKKDPLEVEAKMDNFSRAQRNYDHLEPEMVQDDPHVRLYSGGDTASCYLSYCGEKFLMSLYNDNGSAQVFISATDLRAIADRISEVLQDAE